MRKFGAKVGIKNFYDLFLRRSQGAHPLILRGVEAAFVDSQSDEERAIWAAIQEHRSQEAWESG